MPHPRTLLATLALAVAAAAPALAQVDASDFVPVTDGGAAEVEQAGEVVVADDGVVSAATTQDAINAAVDRNVAAVGGGKPDELAGVTVIEVGSGKGIVATGTAMYGKMDNANATRRDRRRAYLRAHLQAKSKLAGYLGGLSNDAQQTLVLDVLESDDATAGGVNATEATGETIDQAVQRTLRGFVTYEVEDSGEGLVRVSIVTTPKTRGELNRLSPGAVEAGSVAGGIDAVLADLRAGVAVPVGGRVITVPGGGEMAFVGFGSASVNDDPDAAVRQRLRLKAVRVGEARAAAALVGLIVGDENAWRSVVADKSDDAVQDYEEVVSEDPLKAGEVQLEKLGERRQSYLGSSRETQSYRSAQKGTLPPGVTTKNWIDDETGMAYSVAVYLPSVTAEAAGVGRSMDEAVLLKELPGAAAPARTAPAAGAVDGPDVARPGSGVPAAVKPAGNDDL